MHQSQSGKGLSTTAEANIISSSPFLPALLRVQHISSKKNECHSWIACFANTSQYRVK